MGPARTRPHCWFGLRSGADAKLPVHVSHISVSLPHPQNPLSYFFILKAHTAFLLQPEKPLVKRPARTGSDSGPPEGGELSPAACAPPTAQDSPSARECRPRDHGAQTLRTPLLIRSPSRHLLHTPHRSAPALQQRFTFLGIIQGTRLKGCLFPSIFKVEIAAQKLASPGKFLQNAR